MIRRWGKWGLVWPNASLRGYLVAVILLATVPMAALLVPLQISNSLETERQQQHEELRHAAASFASAADREITSTIEALNILAMLAAVEPGNFEGFTQRALTRPGLRRTWSGAFLAHADTGVVYSTFGADPAGLPPALQSAQIADLVSTGAPFVSDLMTLSDGRQMTAIAVPVVVEGKPRYLLGAWIDATVWKSLLVEGFLPAGGAATFSDRTDRQIAGTFEPRQSNDEPLLARRIVSRSGSPAGEATTRLADGSPGYVAWEQVPRAGWSVMVEVPLGPLVNSRRNAVLQLIVSAVGCLAVGVVLALYVARRVSVPLHRLASGGEFGSTGRIAVREIALLRDALLAARAQDEHARELLQTKADEFETLFNSSPIGLAFAQDAHCRVVLHNAAMERSLGSPAAAEGSVRVLHNGAQLDPGQQPLQRAAAHGETTSSLELELVVGESPPKFVLASAAPLLDANGKPRGAIGALVDISDRKMFEARLLAVDGRLRESQRLVDVAQQAGQVGFFHYHFGQDVLGWTPGQAKLFGIEVGDEDGPSLDVWAQRIEPGARQQIKASLNRMLSERLETETQEFRVTLPDGRTRWLSNRLVMTYDPAGEPVQLVGITVDMSDQKSAEGERDALMERAQAARLDAEAANRAKDEFLAMLGHELRNPLSAISSAVEVLNRVDNDTQIAGNARTIIGRQARNLAHLMDDLLDVSRVITGKITLSRQPLDLAALVERLMSTMQLTGATAAHQVHLDLSEAWVDGDAPRIEQVVTNLVMNAVRYTPAGRSIDVSVHRFDADVRLEVRDAGVGISSELLPRIFDLFVQGERALDRRAGGLGIGLTLVRRLLALHGADIDVESSASGSVFRVRFDATTGAPERDDSPAPRGHAKKRSVLVIEDNDDALLALQSILELMGHQVTTASDGPTGLDALLRTWPSVAVVDIGLPGLTGLEVAKQSRSAGYPGRMIAISGYGQTADVRRAMVAGFDAYLVKPVDSTELERLMAED